MELGAREYRNLHILGYGYSLGPSPLADLCNQMRQGREERKYRIIDFLREKGVDISLAEVEELAGEGSIGRPHFAQVMVRRGYVQTNREAFDRYLDTEEYQRIERFKADARTCAEAIKASGGRVSLAHPYQVGLPAIWQSWSGGWRTGGWTPSSAITPGTPRPRRRFTWSWPGGTACM